MDHVLIERADNGFVVHHEGEHGKKHIQVFENEWRMFDYLHKLFAADGQATKGTA